METRHSYPEYKTGRQWALQGYLTKENANGIELWANQYCQDKYVYYSPDDVMKADEAGIKEFFKSERARKAERARIRRQERRKHIEESRKAEQKAYEKTIIQEAITPYILRIIELQRIIRELSADNVQNIAVSDTIIIDTETTGLESDTDELLQVSIIDSDGKILFDSYFKPCVKSWKDAERVNNISPDMVQDAPRISERTVELNTILRGAKKIIGYNTLFDLDFLRNNGIFIDDNADVVDVMREFAPIYGEYNEYYNDYKWQKLTTAAAYYNYNWDDLPEKAHNSLADCFATLYVYNKMQE